MNGRILIIEDDLEMCRMLEADLHRRGAGVEWRNSGNEGIAALAAEEFDVMLTDINLPGMSGIQLCERIAADRPDIPVIIITAFGSMETAVSAIRAGAYDFITKPVDLDILAIAIERALNHRKLKEKVRILTETVERSRGFGEMTGESPVMRDLFSKLERIADTETSVLVTGESGSGKELAARSLHSGSRRRSGPFIAVNCSALPDFLLESELFGHKRGAFTDAKTDRKGLFQEAQHGTLFLDEIGDLPVSLQPKLLRAIEERKVRPVGADTPIDVDVRIIAATNKDLESAIEAGEFREDLFYRVNVVQLEIPPLRVRGTDILLLARCFLKKFADRLEKNITGVSEPAAGKLLIYSWPGNVRELSNAVEYAVALTRHEKLIVEDLPEKIRNPENDRMMTGAIIPPELISLEDLEHRYILHVLKSVENNRTTASRILGVDRKTLYRKMRRYGIHQN